MIRGSPLHLELAMQFTRRSLTPLLAMGACACLVQTGCLLQTNADAEGRDVLSPTDMGKDDGVILLPGDMNDGDMGNPTDMPAPPSDMPTPPADMSSGCEPGQQDNDNDGTCAPDCDTANLGCTGSTAACDDSSGTAMCVPTPESCAQAKALLGTQDDGVYTLYVEQDPEQPWDAVCVGSRTYLPLSVTSGDSNRFEYVDIQPIPNDPNGTFEAIPMAVTSFWMVNIDPSTLQIDIDDYAFAYTEYYNRDIENEGKVMPFGVVESCSRQLPDQNGYLSARGKIDLTNTPFELDQTFAPAGNCADDASPSDSSGQVYDLHIDGGGAPDRGCGYMAPSSFAARLGQRCDDSVITPENQEAVDRGVQLVYRGDAPSVREYPKTCTEIKFTNFASFDGDHVLYADRDPGKPYQVECDGMDEVTMPTFPAGGREGAISEYLELPEQSGMSNAFQRTNDAFQVALQTRYQKVRFDPRTFEVNIVDTTHVQNDVSDPDLANETVKYGIISSLALNNNSPASGRVDLRGTGFAIDDAFGTFGQCPMGDAMFSENNQVADLNVSGPGATLSVIRDASSNVAFCGDDFPDAEGYCSETDFILRLTYP